MNRRLRVSAAAAIAIVGLSAPAVAQQTGDPVDVRGSIKTLEVAGSIKNIEVEESVEDLEVERESAERVALTVAADVLFAFDRATLTPKAEATIERIARRIRSSRGPIRIDGYTDSIGSDAYNLGLSRRRAAAVAKALEAALPSRRISARGHGEADPVAPNTQGSEDNPAGRAKNRRVTISYAR
jgi:OmpA-OmpF porin, OOP family